MKQGSGQSPVNRFGHGATEVGETRSYGSQEAAALLGIVRSHFLTRVLGDLFSDGHSRVVTETKRGGRETGKEIAER